MDCAVNLLGNASRAPGASINHSDTATWTCNSGFETSIGRTHQGFYTADCGDGGDALTADGSCNQVWGGGDGNGGVSMDGRGGSHNRIW